MTLKWSQSRVLLLESPFTFHMRCISIVRSLYFRIFSASFLITFVFPEIATSIIIIIKSFRKTVERNSFSAYNRASPTERGFFFLNFHIWDFCWELSTHWYCGQNWTKARHFTWTPARIYDLSSLLLFKIKTVCFFVRYFTSWGQGSSWALSIQRGRR